MAGWLKNGLVGLVTAATLGLSGPVMAQETNPKGYDVPSTAPDKARLIRTTERTLYGIPCILRAYKSKKNDQGFNTITVKKTGITFAYIMHPSKKAIVTEDCEIYTKSYDSHEHWDIPNCSK